MVLSSEAVELGACVGLSCSVELDSLLGGVAIMGVVCSDCGCGGLMRFWRFWRLSLCEQICHD